MHALLFYSHYDADIVYYILTCYVGVAMRKICFITTDEYIIYALSLYNVCVENSKEGNTHTHTHTADNVVLNKFLN